MLTLAAIAWLAAAGQVSRRERPAAEGQAPVVVPTTPEGELPRHRPPEPLADLVRRFLAAFVRYEVGEPASRWEAALRGAASAALADDLTRRPPRVRSRVPRAH